MIWTDAGFIAADIVKQAELLDGVGDRPANALRRLIHPGMAKPRIARGFNAPLPWPAACAFYVLVPNAAEKRAYR